MEPLTVLVLEDHPFQRSAAVALLRKAGVSHILEAGDGLEAIKKIENYHREVDIVLCDLQMDGMDGIAFLGHMAKEKLAAAVILTSALEESFLLSARTLAKAQKIHVLDILPKPISADQLADGLRKYRESRGQAKPSAATASRDLNITEDEIEQALDQEQFIPYFQPKVSAVDGTLVGAEVLTRWPHPELGFVPPNVFIPIIEKMGLAERFTRLICKKSLVHMKSWLNSGFETCFSLNLSPSLLADRSLPESMAECTAELDIPNRLVIFEITETGFQPDLTNALEILTRLRLKGFGLSIDDYGTGYSTLQQLSRAPFNEIKIDQSFIAEMIQSAKHRSIVASTLDMAKKLGLHTVAEGIETQDQWDMLLAMGCDSLQGFFVAKPMPADQFPRWHRPRKSGGDKSNGRKTHYQGLVGKSQAMNEVYQRIESVAKVKATVLITGETGTGKELVARAIHDASNARQMPFIAVNCGGLTDSLLASQLFGHSRGAFTGAQTDHVGFFEAANGGTLFLDEIGDISLTVQNGLLRVLQESEIVRVGETKPRKINTRILCATRRDLVAEVMEGRFRDDLMYRIRVAGIHLPPLRERSEDIPLLVQYFLKSLAATWKKPTPDISKDAMAALVEYAWPGNVRELKNTLASALIYLKGPTLTFDDLPMEMKQRNDGLLVEPNGDRVYNEKDELVHALRLAKGNRAKAARFLGIGRTTLYRKLEKYGLEQQK